MHRWEMPQWAKEGMMFRWLRRKALWHESYSNAHLNKSSATDISFNMSWVNVNQQQSESFVFIERSSLSLYIFWTKKQDFIDDKHLKTTKQIDKEKTKNERQSFKTWFETLSQMREHEMKMRMKDSFVNVLNRMTFNKSNTSTSTASYLWSQQSSNEFSYSSSSSSSSSSAYSSLYSAYLYFYSYPSSSSSHQQFPPK
jgi:hypothetical protein